MKQYAARSQKQIATPANPASGFNKIYPKSDDYFYTLDSSGNEKKVALAGESIAALGYVCHPVYGVYDTGNYAITAAGQTMAEGTNYIVTAVFFIANGAPQFFVTRYDKTGTTSLTGALLEGFGGLSYTGFVSAYLESDVLYMNYSTSSGPPNNEKNVSYTLATNTINAAVAGYHTTGTLLSSSLTYDGNTWTATFGHGSGGTQTGVISAVIS